MIVIILRQSLLLHVSGKIIFLVIGYTIKVIHFYGQQFTCEKIDYA